MTISNALREQVRKRAAFACEYCGVTETDVGGTLTIDHFQPQSEGGSDNAENLIYCCNRCNEYKSAHWSQSSAGPVIWNPRQEPSSRHFVKLADGRLHALTPTGRFTIERLRLNRSALIAHRLQKRQQQEEQRLLLMYRNAVSSLQQLRQQEADLIQEQHALLEEQRRLLRLLLDMRE